MPDSEARVHLFARGWSHEAWSGAFYPDDLPQEWRLTYYANEFRGVLVPASDWEQASEAALRAWAADVNDSFHFYLERTLGPETERARSRAALLGSRFAGWIVPQQHTAPSGLIDCHVSGPSAGAPAYLLRGGVTQNPAAQRKLLEQVVARSGKGGDLLLFLSGNPPSIGELRKLIQLSQLLGLA